MRAHRRYNDAALVLVALAISVHAALSASTLGDYPMDAGPSLTALLHGDLRAFAQAHPAMGDLSLLVRAPFAALAYLGHPTQLSIYRWGALPCVLSVAALALWLAVIARRRGTSTLGQWAIVLVALLNPLSTNALELGHPEELLTGSLCVAALIAALDGRTALTAVLLGLAVCCKQWSVVVVLPVLFALERSRLRALLGALAVALLVTVPEVVGSPASYLSNQLSLRGDGGRTAGMFSWWWPFAPNTALRFTAHGSSFTFTAHRLPRALAGSGRALVIVADVLAALVVARLRRLALGANSAFALLALVLLLRCTLDNETMPYYLAPLLLALLGWDAVSGTRLPLRSLAGAGVAYVLFDRLTPVAVGGASGVLYSATTAILFIALLRTLATRTRSSSPRPAASLAATT